MPSDRVKTIKPDKMERIKKKIATNETVLELETENEQSVVKSEKKESKKKRKAAEMAENASETEPVISSNPENISENKNTSSPLPSDRPSKKRKSSLASEIEVDITLPEPPSKKDLRRLKKGKTLPPSKSGAGDESETETTTDGVAKKAKPEVEKRSEHGVWIGNLAWSVDKTMLKRFFIENSAIEDAIITRIHMPSPDDGKPANRVSTAPAWKKQNNKGFAYVDFSTADAVSEAIGLSEQLLQGRAVLIKNNKSFDGRPMKTKDEEQKDGKEPSKRIFIGNLRFDATKENVQEHFEQCGPIETIMIATFEDSGKCKGYGWITFQTLEAAEQAVKGWVPYQEEQAESNSDSDANSSSEEDDSDIDSDADSDASPKPSKAKIAKKGPIRRHFIDKISGRPIRREFAEPPQVRYKKRYGKDGTKNQNKDAGGAAEGGEREERVRKPQAEVSREYEPLGKSYAPRLTGAIRKAEGKKVVF